MSLVFAVLFLFGGIAYLIYKGFESGTIPDLFNAAVGNYSKEDMYKDSGRNRRQRISTDIALGVGRADHVFDFFGGLSKGQHAADTLSVYILWLGGFVETTAFTGYAKNTIDSRLKLIEEIYQFSRHRKPITQKRRDEIWLALGCVEEFKANNYRAVDNSAIQGRLFNELLEKYPDTIKDGAQRNISRELFTQKILRQEFLCSKLPGPIRELLIPFSSFDVAEKEYLIFEGYDLDTQCKMLSACRTTLPAYISNGYVIDLDKLSWKDAENFATIYPQYKDILDTLNVYSLDAEILTARFLGLQGKKYSTVKTKYNTTASKDYTYPELIHKFNEKHRRYALENCGESWLNEDNYCYKWTKNGNEGLREILNETKSKGHINRQKNGLIGKICGWIQFIGIATSVLIATFGGYSDLEQSLVTVGVVLWFIFLPLWIYFYWYRYRREKDNDMDFEWAKNLW